MSIAVALPGLVDGVGQDLKHRVLAALQPVGAEDDAGPLPYPIRALSALEITFIIISRFLCHIYPPVYTDHNSLYII